MSSSPTSSPLPLLLHEGDAPPLQAVATSAVASLRPETVVPGSETRWPAMLVLARPPWTGEAPASFRLPSTPVPMNSDVIVGLAPMLPSPVTECLITTFSPAEAPWLPTDSVAEAGEAGEALAKVGAPPCLPDAFTVPAAVRPTRPPRCRAAESACVRNTDRSSRSVASASRPTDVVWLFVRPDRGEGPRNGAPVLPRKGSKLTPLAPPPSGAAAVDVAPAGNAPLLASAAPGVDCCPDGEASTV